MKRGLKFLSIILLTALSVTFISCNKDDNEATANKFVGTWTSLGENYADMMKINADGTVVSSGVIAGDDFRENCSGTMELDGDHISFSFSDGYKFDGNFEIVEGEKLALIDKETGKRLIYSYCEKDYANDILGAWVTKNVINDQAVNTVKYFDQNGNAYTNGYLPTDAIENGTYVTNNAAQYKVFGDLLLIKYNEDNKTRDFLCRIVCSSDKDGDVMIFSALSGNSIIWNRIKQDLDLLNCVYSYNDIYVTNVKGLDKDIDFHVTTINFSHVDGIMFDKVMKSLLYTMEFPNNNTIKYGYTLNGESKYLEAPISLEDNALTVLMSQRYSYYKDVQFYAFQSNDNSSLHMYMSRQAYVNFLANMKVTIMIQMGILDPTDTAAVNAVFQTLEDAVESIDLTLIFETGKKPIQPM